MIRKDVTDLIVRSIVPSLAKDKGVITEDRIKEFAWDKFPDMIAQMNGFDPLTDEERTEVQKELASRFLHVRDLNALVFCKPYEPWLETAKPRINPRFGTDYSRYLLDESRFSVDTVNSIESTTDRILDYIF